MRHVWMPEGAKQRSDMFGAFEAYELWTCRKCGFTWEDDEGGPGVPEEHPLIPSCEIVQVSRIQES